MRRLLQAIASGGLRTGSLLARPDVLPSLNIFDAMKIFMDPDDDNGRYNGTIPWKPDEKDCRTSYGFLCTPGVVTMQTTPEGTALHPNAIFLRPNSEFSINIGGFGGGGLAPGIKSFFTWKPGKPEDRGVRPNPWMYPPPELPLDGPTPIFPDLLHPQGSV
jgi:hypothetical protein